MSMFYHHLRNELWKLFGKKRTYIGFGAFLLAQNGMLITFHYTHWQTQMEAMLEGNGYLAQEYVSALTVAVLPTVLVCCSRPICNWGVNTNPHHELANAKKAARKTSGP